VRVSLTHGRFSVGVIGFGEDDARDEGERAEKDVCEACAAHRERADRGMRLLLTIGA
jgi:hypothetical protein